MENNIGINRMDQSGFVAKYITLFESKKGTPAIRFVISCGEKPFSFFQNVVVYGNRAVELSETLEKGDLVFVAGKKMILYLSNAEGYKENIPCLVSNMCYILESKINREKRQS